MNGYVKPSSYCSKEILELFKNRAIREADLLEKLKIVPRRMLAFLAQTIQDFDWFQEHRLFLTRVFREISVQTVSGTLKLREVRETFSAIIRFEPDLLCLCVDNDIRFSDSQFACSRLMLMLNAERFVKEAPPAAIKEMFPYLTKRQMGLYYRSYLENDMTFLASETSQGLWDFAKQFNLDQNRIFLAFVEKHLISFIQDITTAFEFFPLAVKLQLRELEQHIIRFICNYRGGYIEEDALYIFHVRGAGFDQSLATIKAISRRQDIVCGDTHGLDLLSLKIHTAKGCNWKLFYGEALSKDENRLVIDYRPNAFIGVTNPSILVNESLNLHNIQAIEVPQGPSGKVFCHILLGVLYFLSALKRLIFNHGEFLTEGLLKKIAHVKRIDQKNRLGEKIECLELGKCNLSEKTWESLPDLFPNIDLIKISDIVWPNHLLERLLKIESMQSLLLLNISSIESFCKMPQGLFKKLKVFFIENVRNLTRKDVLHVLTEASELIYLNAVHLEKDVFLLNDLPENSQLKILVTSIEVLRSWDDVEKLIKLRSIEKVVFRFKASISEKQKEMLDIFLRSTRALVSLQQDEIEPKALLLFQSV